MFLAFAIRKLALDSNGVTSVGHAAGSVSVQRRMIAKQASQNSDGPPAAYATVSPSRDAACIALVT